MEHERRRYPRLAESFEIEFRPMGGWVEPWRVATSVNLSANGIRFRTEEALEVGVSVEVRFKVPSLPEVIQVQGAVIWAQMQAPGVTEHGVEFRHVTPEQQTEINHLAHFLRKPA